MIKCQLATECYVVMKIVQTSTLQNRTEQNCFSYFLSCVRIVVQLRILTHWLATHDKMCVAVTFVAEVALLLASCHAANIGDVSTRTSARTVYVAAFI